MGPMQHGYAHITYALLKKRFQRYNNLCIKFNKLILCYISVIINNNFPILIHNYIPIFFTIDYQRLVC